MTILPQEPDDEMNQPYIEIPLTQGQVARVSPEDADLTAHKWTALYNPRIKSYTALRTIAKGQHELMHRVILSRMLDRPLLPSEHVDHIRHNTLDNRRTEIRLATPSQNAQNRRRRRDNASGVQGVSWDKRIGKWHARIRAAGKNIDLGFYDDLSVAAEVRRLAELAYFGDFALKNDPLLGAQS